MSAARVLLALALTTSITARAEEVEAPVAPAQTAAKEDPTAAAQAAAEAAKAAAEAAKLSADALKTALESLNKAQAAAPAPAPVVEVPAPAKKDGPPPWAFQLGVSLLSVTGNANSITGKVAGQADGTFGKWATKLVGGATYGQTQAPSSVETEVTALNANLSAKGSRAFSEMVNAYVLGGAMTDRVASISMQGFGEVGAGLVWWNEVEGDFVKSRFSTDLGFRFTRENRATYYPDFSDLPNIDIYSPRVSGSFRYALSKTAVFTEEFEVLPDVVNSANLRATSTSVISAQLDAGVALSLGFKARYIGAPAPGAKKTDTELSAGVTWAF